MKTDDICKIHHTTAFEKLMTIDDEPMEICRRGSSIFFILHYNNNPQILENLSILVKNGTIYLVETFHSSFSNSDMIIKSTKLLQ